MYGYDLIVADAEFVQTGKRVHNFCDALESQLKAYGTVLDDMCANAVKAGQLHDALILFKEYVDKTGKLLEGLGENVDSLVGEFINKMEEADDYLYEASLGEEVRDFSDKEYDALCDCLDTPICDVTDGIGDFIYGGYQKMLRFWPWGKSAKESLQEWKQGLLDYNDETKTGLNYLFEKVYKIDVEYGRRDDVNYCTFGDWEYNYVSNFLKVVYALDEIKSMLNEMTEVISMGKSGLTNTVVQSRLGKKYDLLEEELNQAIVTLKKKQAITEEEIAAFASKPESIMCFYDYNAAQTKFMRDTGFWDAAGMVFFNMFDIAEREMIYEDYEENMKKKLLMSTISEIMESELYKGTEKEEALDSFKDLLEYVKKHGEKWYEVFNETEGKNGKLLDGRTKAAKRFKEFLDSLGGAGKILSHGTEVIEYLAELFADYSRGVEIIESFERNYSGDAAMLKCVGEIKALYNKEYGAWLGKTFEGIANIGVEGLIDITTEALPCVNVVKKIGDGIDVVGKIIGVGDMNTSKLDAMFYVQLYTSSNAAYSNALDKFRAADVNSEEYHVLAQDLNNCFELNKNNLIQMLEKMTEASSGTEKSYYRYCADQAKKLSMTGDNPRIMEYDQFVAKYGA